MTKKRISILYSGNVQGVGFRYRTDRIAGEFELNGWVRNLPDGRVEIVAEGQEKQLSEFVSRIEEAMGMYISSKQASWSDPAPGLGSFAIKF